MHLLHTLPARNCVNAYRSSMSVLQLTRTPMLVSCRMTGLVVISYLTCSLGVSDPDVSLSATITLALLRVPSDGSGVLLLKHRLWQVLLLTTGSWSLMESLISLRWCPLSTAMFAGPRPAGTAHRTVPFPWPCVPSGVGWLALSLFLVSRLCNVRMPRLLLLTGMFLRRTLVDRNIRSDPTQSGDLVHMAALVGSRSIETTRSVRNVLDAISIRSVA